MLSVFLMVIDTKTYQVNITTSHCVNANQPDPEAISGAISFNSVSNDYDFVSHVM